jgi:hypothetical protein
LSAFATTYGRFQANASHRINVSDESTPSERSQHGSLASSSIVVPSAPSLVAPSRTASTTGGKVESSIAATPSAAGSSFGGSWEDDAEFVALSDTEDEEHGVTVHSDDDFTSDDELWEGRRCD